MKILMVCLGNICRSPLAEGILARKAKDKGLDWVVDSAGTSGWHDGDPPDERSIEVARLHDLDISQQKSRKIRSTDFDEFDLIYVMDDQNLQDVLRYCHTDEERNRVAKIMDVLPESSRTNVPDPYYGQYGFELVYNMLDEACDKIIENAETIE
ncbi:low molecular weight phosphotyrosine protein phosphatase [Membranicola marinus]|uniref:protein-tyrosine-phosphatase n=1 Tax=Membranihabitans marinus TaxID=1227546 RepID=A0A953HSQ9_9BACT|nr:low molecular weight protein-tyrosine-phosphatase [Membranihabitans marinus]MBY5957228.1 low molecular weight phosphotyrosine protein phosphatase [Membranihabitans marinus]